MKKPTRPTKGKGRATLPKSPPPKPVPKAPPPPVLSEEQVLWSKYADLLKEQNRYHPGYAAPLMELVRAQLLLRRLDYELENCPELFYGIAGRNGEQRKPAPEILAVQQARRQFLQICGSFGLSPIASSKLPATDNTPADEFASL